MEHLEHFGLAQDPFVNDPLTRFFFPSRLHTDAERRLLRCVRQGKGLGVLVGEAGCGKTTLLRHLFEQFDEASFEAVLLVMVHDDVDPGWLLARLAGQLGVEEPASERRTLLGQIYERLIAVREEGRHTVVLVDEAQMLARRDIMTELRGLLNLEHEEKHLLSLLVAGLPELDQALALDKSLEQRIDIKVHLDALDADSAAAYLAHRLRAAGGDPGLLEPDAVALVVRMGQGVPRLMNTLADNALYEAYLEERPRVGAADVERAARDLGLWQADPVATPAAAQLVPAPPALTRPMAPECPLPAGSRPAPALPDAASLAPPALAPPAFAPPLPAAMAAPAASVPPATPSVQPSAAPAFALPPSAPIAAPVPPPSFARPAAPPEAAPVAPPPAAAPYAAPIYVTPAGASSAPSAGAAPAPGIVAAPTSIGARPPAVAADDTTIVAPAPDPVASAPEHALFVLPPFAETLVAPPPAPAAMDLAARVAALEAGMVFPPAPSLGPDQTVFFSEPPSVGGAARDPITGMAPRAAAPLPPAAPSFDLEIDEDPFAVDAPDITVNFDTPPGDSAFGAPPSHSGLTISGLPPQPAAPAAPLEETVVQAHDALPEPEVAPVFDDSFLEHPNMNVASALPIAGPPKDESELDELFGVLDEDGF